jgi:hypothetical protein
VAVPAQIVVAGPCGTDAVQESAAIESLRACRKGQHGGFVEAERGRFSRSERGLLGTAEQLKPSRSPCVGAFLDLDALAGLLSRLVGWVGCGPAHCRACE